MNKLIVVSLLFGFFKIVHSVKTLDISKDGLCTPLQHSCSGIACISQENVCDGTADCADHSDEANCAPGASCPVGEVACKTKYGTTMCVSSHSPVCIGCGAPPTISNGNALLKNISEKSAIGAWGKVICNDGYETCTSMIRCLPSRIWTTATCEPEPQVIKKKNGIICFVCKNRDRDSLCNTDVEQCDENQSCITEIDYDFDENTMKILYKDCKNPAESGPFGCKWNGLKSFCREKCDKNKCNEYYYNY